MNDSAVQEGAPEPPVGPLQNWGEFCEFHAIATARDLAAHYRHFASGQQWQDVVTADSFSRHFSDLFQQYFCSEVAREDPSQTPPSTPPPPLAPPPPARGCWRIMSFPGVQGCRYPERPGPQTLLALLASKVEPLVPGVPRARLLPPERPPADAARHVGPLLGGLSQEGAPCDQGGGIRRRQASDCWYPNPLLPAPSRTAPGGLMHLSV
ncbi:hypothetical protein SKAU_G00355780, partial [Synaphobranchus kaupii]